MRSQIECHALKLLKPTPHMQIQTNLEHVIDTQHLLVT